MGVTVLGNRFDCGRSARGPQTVRRISKGLDLTQNYKIKLLDGAPLRTKLRTLMLMKFR